jgi:hypothetical protein
MKKTSNGYYWFRAPATTGIHYVANLNNMKNMHVNDFRKKTAIHLAAGP